MAEVAISSQRSVSGRRRSLIPWVFPAAMVPVLAANAALVSFALHSMPALVSTHPFEDGRTYNREIAAATAQDRLGWAAQIDTPTRAFVASPVRFEVTDRAGAPVAGIAVELRAWRPVGSAPELGTQLHEEKPGRYTAELALPLPGQWQFDLVAKRGADEFVLGRRIVVK